MIKKILLTFMLCLSFVFIVGCKDKPLFEDKCKNGLHGELEWVVVKESTCSQVGEKQQVCKKCNEIITTAKIPTLEHTESSDWIIIKDSTCSTLGSKQKLCTVCNEVITTAIIQYKDHTEGSDWIIDADSTCTSTGSKHKECSICNETIMTEVIPAKDHEEEIISGLNATCTEDGFTNYIICSVCDAYLTEPSLIPAPGHNYIIDEELSTELVLVYKCHCGDTYEKQNESGSLCDDGHTESEWITTLEATCTSFGSAHKVCTVCDIELEIKDLEKLPHIESEWITTLEATCTTLGSAHKVCTICEAETAIKSLEKLPHTEEKVPGTPAKCEEEGLTDGVKCSKCDYVIKEQTTLPALEHDYKVTKTVYPTDGENGYIEYTCSNCNHSYQKVLEAGEGYDETLPTTIVLSDDVIIISNNNGGVVVNGSEVIITLAGEYDIVGEINEGSILIALGEEDNAIINLRGVKLTSTTTNPIYIESGNEVDISAKADTLNYIYDKRTATTTDAVGGAIYSLVDLDIKGKGYLEVTSTYNNGIATTKDLNIKNLTLEANAPNNALKGNDSLTIESGTIKAISSSGDALKTENSDISSKGNQRGIITIIDGTLDLYAACDGIDAAYDCIIEGGTINIYTEKYSTYSGDVTVNSTSTLYLRVSSRASGLSSISKYSAMFIFEDNKTTFVNGTYVSANGKKYYKFDVPSGSSYVKFFAYNSSQTEGQSTSYAYATDQMTIPASYDTYYVNSAASSRLSGSWENYNAPTGGMGGPGGGMGGPMEGNSNKAAYSCKGIKADNSILINGGTINIKSHDDGIHTNSDVLLGTGNYGVASLTISGGNVTVYSDDDGLHADGTLTVDGGNVIISNSYEGLEGNYIYFKGGTVQIKSSDDGINAKTTLYFQGSIVYLDAGGDGIDSNGNVYMTAGVVLALGPTNGGNGVIDYGDRNCTFSFTGGLLLAVGCSGMNAKPTAGTGNTVSATTPGAPSIGSYLTVTSNGNVVAVLKVTKSSQNYRVLAYNNTAYPSTTVSVTTTTSVTLTNDLYYVAK